MKTLLGVEELHEHVREGRSLARLDETLTFIHAAKGAEAVRLRGGLQYPLSPVTDTDIWTVTLRIAELDKLGFTYAFSVDGKAPLVDAIEWRGAKEPKPALADVLAGAIVEHTLRGQVEFGERTVSVYESPRVGSEPVRAVIFMADGQSLPDIARVVEPLVTTGEIPRVRLVGVHAAQGKRRMFEYIFGLTRTNTAFLAHERFLLEDVLPFVAREYPTLPGTLKVIMGYSNGGDLAAAVATRHPRRFDAAIVLSPAWSAPGEWGDGASELVVYLGAGTLEPSFHKAAIDLSQRFSSVGVLHALEANVGGHEMELWRAFIPEALVWTFEQLACGSRDACVASH